MVGASERHHTQASESNSIQRLLLHEFGGIPQEAATLDSIWQPLWHYNETLAARRHLYYSPCGSTMQPVWRYK